MAVALLEWYSTRVRNWENKKPSQRDRFERRGTYRTKRNDVQAFKKNYWFRLAWPGKSVPPFRPSRYISLDITCKKTLSLSLLYSVHSLFSPHSLLIRFLDHSLDSWYCWCCCRLVQFLFYFASFAIRPSPFGAGQITRAAITLTFAIHPSINI